MKCVRQGLVTGAIVVAVAIMTGTGSLWHRIDVSWTIYATVFGMAIVVSCIVPWRTKPEAATAGTLKKSATEWTKIALGIAAIGVGAIALLIPDGGVLWHVVFPIIGFSVGAATLTVFHKT